MGFVVPVTATGGPGSEAPILDGMAGSGTQEDPYQITNATELQAMDEDRDAHYVLATDIDASETADWNRRTGFEPVGGEGSDDAFSGSLDGQNHTISGLTIDYSERYVGLFSLLDQATVEHVTLVDADVRGEKDVGGLAGRATESTLRNVGVGGTVTARDGTAGGVAASIGQTEVVHSYATADVTGSYDVGGLVGKSQAGVVDGSYATGAVVGELDRGTYNVGGLVGRNSESAVVASSFATGSVEGDRRTGGLVGENGGTIQRAYATGTVSDGESAGALVGINDGTAENAYWNEETAGVGFAVAGGSSDATALTTDEMTGSAARSNMAGLDFGGAWAATDSYPVLARHVTGVSLSAPEQVITDRAATATVQVSLTDGRSVAATETADYGTNGSVLSVDRGVLQPSGTGAVEVTATVASHADSAVVSVVTPPDISVEDRSLRYDRVGSETAAPVNVTLTNDGGADGTFDVVLSVDDSREQTRTVTVAGHSTRTVQVDYAAPATGTYSVAVNGTALGNLTVVDEPETSVASATTSEEPLAVGNATTVEATLENAGDAAAGHTVELTVDGDSIATKDVVVPADGTTVRFDYTADSTGEYDLAVGDRNAGTLTVAEMGNVSVEGASVPDTVQPGERYEVTATLSNSGGLALTADVTYSVGGSAVATETVEVPADGTTVTFEATAPEDGESVEHAISVSDTEWTGSTAVDVSTPTPTATPDAGGAETGGDGSESGSTGDDERTTSDDGAGFGVVAVLVALATVATIRRRRTN